jgi:hypothetical protein
MSTRTAPELGPAFSALRKDLMHADGPRISTMRNHRFALLQYLPRDELAMRAEVQRLSADLEAHGWVVLSLDLHKLLLDRLRAQGENWIERVQAMERRLTGNSAERGLSHLLSKIGPCIEGPQGLSADCSRIICAHADAHPDRIDRTLALIGGAGALYPFYRSSAILKHLDGHTQNIPVVFLYPGELVNLGEVVNLGGVQQLGGTQGSGHTGLSFMGRLSPDNDYRPRIYQGGKKTQ